MYFNKEIQDIYKELDTNSKGLSSKEARLRLKKYGKNSLPKKKNKTILKIFLGEFKDPIVVLLLFAIFVSFLAGEIIDAVAIFMIVLIDAIMGTYQENKANTTADKLSNLVGTKVDVVRDNKIVSIDGTDLTIGDFVLLESGDKICADLRIVESHNLVVDESILTGESTDVLKNSLIIDKDRVVLAEQYNMLFAGTVVVTGRCKAVVTNVGINTEIGKIAKSINETEDTKSPLTIRVEKLSKQISFLVLIVALIITVLLIIKDVNHKDIFLSVIALAVSAMPEGLPLALTMALTIASNKMAKQNVIVRKLKSAESLGSCTVIASDKTGTLTVNQQTAKIIVLPNDLKYDITGTGYDLKGEVKGEQINLAKDISTLTVLNNEAVLDNDTCLGDSIDIAFLVLGKKLNIKTHDIKVLETIPYESENKFSAVFYEKDNDIYCTVKGSLEVITGFCKDINLLYNKDFRILEKQNEELASKGYRVISVANGKINKQKNYTIDDIKNLSFMGMVGFIDPIREDAIDSINSCNDAGIKVLMITGDHPLTAFSIGQDLNLTNNFNEVVTGNELEEEFKKGHKHFDKFIKSKKIFARVTPLQKLNIVESLKRQGEYVAVTGDGVNDAPALKSANIGIAMGSGTDIAIDTADMIIVDDNFKTIVSGIKEGRVAYANIRKIIYFLISCGLSEVLFFCLSIMADLPMPLVAIQLLWLNVVTDGIQDFALSFEKAEKGILKENPRNPKESIFNGSLLREIIVSGTVIGLIIFLVWHYLLTTLNMNVNLARGYVMALMVFIQNIHVFNCRSESKSAFSVPLKNNWFIFLGVFASIMLQVIVMEVPILSKFLKTSSIPFTHLLILFIVSLSVLVLVETYKNINLLIKRESR